MRTTTLAALAAAVALAAGCSAGPTTSPTPPLDTNTTTVPPDPYADEEMYGPRVELPGGILLKQPGKVAEYGAPWVVRLVVENIAVDPPCDEGKPPPQRGHRVVLTLTVHTSAAFDPDVHPAPVWYQWSTIGEDKGSEAPMSSYDPCHPLVQLPNDFRPAATYRGEVDVDTTNATGRVVLGDLFAWDY